MLGRGEIDARDVAFSIDADGQHEPAALDGMIDHLIATDSVCVIGRRDMGYHTSYKKFGNSVMTWIGRVSGGHRFEDIESGYRVFRVGPLLEAQQYYKGYKYSETVEVAVLLTRLGYNVDNTLRHQHPRGPYAHAALRRRRRRHLHAARLVPARLLARRAKGATLAAVLLVPPRRGIAALGGRPRC